MLQNMLYSNLKARIAFIASLLKPVGQGRNCNRKSCLLNCWLLLL